MKSYLQMTLKLSSVISFHSRHKFSNLYLLFDFVHNYKADQIKTYAFEELLGGSYELQKFYLLKLLEEILPYEAMPMPTKDILSLLRTLPGVFIIFSRLQGRSL